MENIKEFITESNDSLNNKKIKNVIVNYRNAANNVYTEGLKFLKEFLTDKGFYYFEDDNETITVSYDGGDYVGGSLSNPFSVADGIFVKNGTVFVSCEEDTKYGLHNANAQDIANIIEYVLTH